MKPISTHSRGAMIAAVIPMLLVTLSATAADSRPAAEGPWRALFDGQSLRGWKASEHSDTWRQERGLLVAEGARSHLFYDGPVGNHDFRNFELELDVKTGPLSNAGVFIHTEFQASGEPSRGYKVLINNARSEDAHHERHRTGSLYPVRNIYQTFVGSDPWFRVRVRVVGKRVRVWVNDLPTVDYIEPDAPSRDPSRRARVLSHGTIALQGYAPRNKVAFRSVRVRLLSDDADSMADSRSAEAPYGLKPNMMDRLAAASVPIIDYHIHLRGGMTPEKAIQRQAVTGINSGVLRNLGKGWPIETDDQLRTFLDRVQGLPLFVGLQVNDRDWMDRHSPALLKRLDFVLADTMIMPMPDDDGEPVKLWMTENYTIDDPEQWMQRYMRHNLRVLAEPISILANPTYLPPPVADRYDQLWTAQRMRTMIQAAVKNHVALEINASSQWPHERFIRMAKAMGATFTFGSNNFNDKPINMARCLDAVNRYRLTKDAMFVPTRRWSAE